MVITYTTNCHSTKHCSWYNIFFADMTVMIFFENDCQLNTSLEFTKCSEVLPLSV